MFISSTVLSFYYVKKPENIKYQINDCHGWMKRTIPWFHRLFRFYCNYTYCDEGVNFWHLKRFTVNVLFYGIADTSARSIDLLRDKCRNWIGKDTEISSTGTVYNHFLINWFPLQKCLENSFWGRWEKGKFHLARYEKTITNYKMYLSSTRWK